MDGEQKFWVSLVVAVSITILGSVYFVTNANRKFVENGLQHCVIGYDNNGLQRAWQRECQTVTVSFTK